MRSDTATCPYCNADLPALAHHPLPESNTNIAKGPSPSLTDSHTACPRCGEPLPTERFPVRTTAAPASPASPYLPQRKRRTAHVLLAIMTGMAAVALVFALLTQKWRRDHDFKYKSSAIVPLAEEPDRLLGLSYLPRGCNIAAAVQLAALMEDDTGRALLREPRPLVVESLLEPLAVAGLSIADVDHVVAGTVLKELPFQITTIVVTRKPYDPARVQQAVERQPVKPGTFRNRPLFRLTDKPGSVPKLWLADARVLVYTTLSVQEMEQIPAAVKEPAETLTPTARNALTAMLDKQSRIWAVGDLAPAKPLIDALPLIAGPFKDQAHLLTLVRAFDIGILTGEARSLTVRGDFYTGTAAGTQALAKYLAGVSVQGAKSQKVETPPADVHAAAAQWVNWQLRGDADALRDALGKLSLTQKK